MYNHREIAPLPKAPMIRLILLIAALSVTAALPGYNSTIPFYHTGDDTAVS